MLQNENQVLINLLIMRIILFILCLFPLIAFTQENPWENKKETENPWGNYSTKSETDTTTVEKEVQKTENLVPISEQQQKKLLKRAKEEAKGHFKERNSFIVGTASGIILNMYGSIADGIYAAVNSKKEKEAIDRTMKNPAYAQLDQKILRKKLEDTIKLRKFYVSFAGTVIGSIAQILIVFNL